jgi:prevent-host-death family protein
MYIIDCTYAILSAMEVSITKFRREMFDLVNQAMAGADIRVVHKGKRFRIVPEGKPGSRLSRITPLEVLNPESTANAESDLLTEMTRAWEKDWADL